MAEGVYTGMLNLRQFQTDADDWGISLRERFELDGHIRGGLKPLDAFEDEDRRDEDFRARVADVLIKNDLINRSSRYLECGRFGYCLQCAGAKPHTYFAVQYCDLRFCPLCGPRMFMRLYEKYYPVLSYVTAHPRRGFRLRELTLTSRNVGDLTPEQIKKFNSDVKKTLKIVMRSHEGWGAIWCDEVGFSNHNLHAHVLLFGPYVEQRLLAEAWHEVSGHQVVWIKQAPTDGRHALRYLLKYVSKPPSDDPEFIGQLEVAFYRCRRVHTLGLFYNFATREKRADPCDAKTCPECGAPLRRLTGNAHIKDLALRGIPFIGAFDRAKTRKSWVN